MKKVISLFMSIVMMLTMTFAFAISTQAATSCNNAVVSANVAKIKKAVRDNNKLNVHDEYYISYAETDDDGFIYLGVFTLDPKTDKLSFLFQGYKEDGESLISSLEMEIKTPATSTVFTREDYWINSDMSDIIAVAYLDRNFDHKKQYANFRVTLNETSLAEKDIISACNEDLAMAFVYWDFILQQKMDMDMGAVGFYSYCRQHDFKQTVVKANSVKDGYTSNCCQKCGCDQTTIIPRADMKLSATNYVYDGKVKKPTVTVKGIDGKVIPASNYDIVYPQGMKNVGIYSVTVKYKGDKYAGFSSMKFNISPKSTTVSKVTSPKSKQIKVTWKKQATQTNGYEIQYSTKSNFKSAKTVKVTKNSTTSKTISKLSGKKKYYVRIRTYKNVKYNGKTTQVYSSWSKAKTITTKK